jgi:hypothetical protein
VILGDHATGKVVVETEGRADQKGSVRAQGNRIQDTSVPESDMTQADDGELVVWIMDREDWRHDILEHLSNPSKVKSKKICQQALKYMLVDDELHRRTVDGVLLKCLSKEQSRVTMGEVHEGLCGTH